MGERKMKKKIAIINSIDNPSTCCYNSRNEMHEEAQ